MSFWDNQEGEDRCGHLRRRLQGAQHPLEAQSERTQNGLRAEVGRKRCGGHGAVVRFQQCLSFVAEMLERCRQAAQSARRIGVVEVLGERSGGWRCKREWPCAPMPSSYRRFLMTSARSRRSCGRGKGRAIVRIDRGSRRREAIGRSECATEDLGSATESRALSRSNRQRRFPCH